MFGLILDTFYDERNGYHFETNPAGAKWDAQMVNEGREVNANWDGVWTVHTRMGEAGWYAEIAIPFRTLKFTSASPQTWGINFLRRIRRRNEDSFWSPIPRTYRLNRVSLAGTLEGLQGLRPGKECAAVVQHRHPPVELEHPLQRDPPALSDFFLVYNDRRDTRSGDVLNRAVVAKMTYMVQF